MVNKARQLAGKTDELLPVRLAAAAIRLQPFVQAGLAFHARRGIPHHTPLMQHCLKFSQD